MIPYRVLVVDDSVFMRKIISDLIAENPRFQVVGTGKNGKEAVEKAKLLKPDVITMDIEMPEMNGLEALELIMAECPTPIVMLSSLTREGAYETIRALELGAIDFVCKPSGSISFDLFKVKSELIEKLQVAAQTKLSTSSRTWRQTLSRPVPTQTRQVASKPVRVSSKFEHLVAIGTSTGGPRALYQVLTQIPGAFAAPILVVQHMPPNFTKSLAQRLHAAAQIHVVEAEDGLLVTNGVAYIAPGGWHMRLARDESHKYRIRLSKEPPRAGHRPSVDTMFESLVPFTELKRHIVLMTGMGSDGARGMLALKEAGALTTIAESEETCVVYGMPRAAVELGCVTHILPQQEIAAKLAQCVGAGS